MNKIIIVENSNPIKKRRKRLILLDILTESETSFKERQESYNRFETNNYLDIIEFAKKRISYCFRWHNRFNKLFECMSIWFWH